jgi:hypothetical protein
VGCARREAGGRQGEGWEEQQGVSREGAEGICMDAYRRLSVNLGHEAGGSPVN